MKLKIISTVLAGITFMCLSMAGWSQDLVFDNFDLNENQLINQAEFTAVFTKHYIDDWNLRDNTGLDDEDFFYATFDQMDINRDTFLMKDEWVMGYPYYLEGHLVNDYIIYDLDRDNVITYS